MKSPPSNDEVESARWPSDVCLFQVFKCECNSNLVYPSIVAQKLYYTTDDKNMTEIALINQGMISQTT